jgi:hypothetical protein
MDMAKSVSNTDINLGALEASLRKNVELLRPLITELAAKSGVHITIFSKDGSSSALQSWASDESIEDAELQDSPLRDYYDSLSKERALKEQIDDIMIQQREMNGRKTFFAEQGRSIPDSLEHSHATLRRCLTQLEQDYAPAQAATEKHRARCEELGVIEPKTRGLSNSVQQPQRRQQQKVAGPNRVHQWLQGVRPQDSQPELFNDINAKLF